MNTFRVIASLLAFSGTFAHGSYIPTERDAPFDSGKLLPRDPLPSLSSSSLSSLAASNAPPSPSTPPAPKLLSPLPAEINGVLLNGTAINPNPDNDANATTRAHSCWTKPVKPAVSMKEGDFTPGHCQVCVTRWDTGADPVFQFWIRDALNHAMGEVNATSLSVEILYRITTTAGNKIFTLWESDYPAMLGEAAYSAVYMSWQANTEVLISQMAFMPFSVSGPSVENCSFSGSTESGTVTHFQCVFECHH